MIVKTDVDGTETIVTVECAAAEIASVEPFGRFALEEMLKEMLPGETRVSGLRSYRAE